MHYAVQRSQPPIFDQISAQNLSQILKSAPNKPKKARICNETRFATKAPICQMQLEPVIIGMIPATPSMHENHAFDHKKSVKREFKK